jgi:hypothetical protein
MDDNPLCGWNSSWDLITHWCDAHSFTHIISLNLQSSLGSRFCYYPCFKIGALKLGEVSLAMVPELAPSARGTEFKPI